jgi:hypothetical protein
MNQNSENSPKIIDLASFRAKKNVKEDLGKGREPLFISHMDGKLSGSPHMKRPEAEDFGDRLSRIKLSLEKINRLMAELKKVSNKEEAQNNAPVSILSKK